MPKRSPSPRFRGCESIEETRNPWLQPHHASFETRVEEPAPAKAGSATLLELIANSFTAAFGGTLQVLLRLDYTLEGRDLPCCESLIRRGSPIPGPALLRVQWIPACEAVRKSCG
jgi:hypothetical protein